MDKFGEALKVNYMKEMERLFAQLNELSRRLERPLKDLDDIKGAIDILRKTRDLELDMDDAIEPIEVMCSIRLPINAHAHGVWRGRERGKRKRNV